MLPPVRAQQTAKCEVPNGKPGTPGPRGGPQSSEWPWQSHSLVWISAAPSPNRAGLPSELPHGCFPPPSSAEALTCKGGQGRHSQQLFSSRLALDVNLLPSETSAKSRWEKEMALSRPEREFLRLSNMPTPYLKNRTQGVTDCPAWLP